MVMSDETFDMFWDAGMKISRKYLINGNISIFIGFIEICELKSIRIGFLYNNHLIE